MRHLLRSALVLILVAVLCGCAGPPAASPRASPPPAAPATAPSTGALAPLALTRPELLSALPENRELYPWRVQLRCSAKAACTELDGGLGRAVYVSAQGDESRGVPEFLLLAGVRWRDDARADRALRVSRRDASEDYGGAFSTEPVRLDDDGRYRYGRHGHGRVQTLEWPGWEGYERVATLRYEHLDGRTSARFREVFLYFERDRYTVQVIVRTLLARRGPDSARHQADEQARALLARLEDLGRAGGEVTTQVP